MTFTKWMKEQQKLNEDNIFAPAMDAQTAVNMLCEYLLGVDWNVSSPIAQEQINTEIVYEILSKYSKEYKKEKKRRKKGLI